MHQGEALNFTQMRAIAQHAKQAAPFLAEAFGMIKVTAPEANGDA